MQQKKQHINRSTNNDKPNYQYDVVDKVEEGISNEEADAPETTADEPETTDNVVDNNTKQAAAAEEEVGNKSVYWKKLVL